MGERSIPPPLPPRARAYVVYPPIPFPRVGGASQLLSAPYTYARMQQLLSAAYPSEYHTHTIQYPHPAAEQVDVRAPFVLKP